MDSDEAMDTQDCADQMGVQRENDTERIVRKINSEQAHREMFVHTLSAVKKESCEADLRRSLDAMPEMKLSLRSSRDYLEELESVGALKSNVECEESVECEKGQGGELPEGSRTWFLTDAGTAALEILAPSRRFESLLASEPGEEALFRWVLDFCESPRTRCEIESALALAEGVSCGEGLEVSYYLDRLERCGMLVWDGGWRLSDQVS